MIVLWFLVLGVIVLWVMVLLAKQKTSRPKEQKRAGEIIKKLPLSIHEQKMYWRLMGALPDLVVLAQVSFSALITNSGKGSGPLRNTFDRKTADFVVLDKGFNVLAVVELDDNSHKGRAGEDAKRDALLTDAGLRVIRYPRIPDIDKVHADFREARMLLIEQRLKREQGEATQRNPTEPPELPR